MGTGGPRRRGRHGGSRIRVADARAGLSPVGQLRSRRPGGPGADVPGRGPAPCRPGAPGAPGRRRRPQRPRAPALPPHGKPRPPADGPGVEDPFLHAGRRAVPPDPGARAGPARESRTPLPAPRPGRARPKRHPWRRRAAPRGADGTAPVPGRGQGRGRERFRRRHRVRRPRSPPVRQGAPSGGTPAGAHRHGRPGHRVHFFRFVNRIET